MSSGLSSDVKALVELAKDLDVGDGGKSSFFSKVAAVSEGRSVIGWSETKTPP